MADSEESEYGSSDEKGQESDDEANEESEIEADEQNDNEEHTEKSAIAEDRCMHQIGVNLSDASTQVKERIREESLFCGSSQRR